MRGRLRAGAMEPELRTIDIIAVGDPNELMRPVIEGYEKLLAEHVALRVAQIPGEPAKAVRGMPVSDEARRVAATVEAIESERGGGFPILLCDHYGDALTSPEFAQTFTSLPYLCVVVGGIMGLHDVIGDREIRRVSFGRATLSPSLARLVIVDQLYRALLSGRGMSYDMN